MDKYVDLSEMLEQMSFKAGGEGGRSRLSFQAKWWSC